MLPPDDDVGDLVKDSLALVHGLESTDGALVVVIVEEGHSAVGVGR